MNGVVRAMAFSTLLAGLVVANAGATPRPVTETAQFGNVQATLTYDYDPQAEDFRQTYTHLRLVIARAGTVVLDVAPQPVCADCSTWQWSGGSSKSSAISVADLDRNGEPVVLLDLYTGGAHCCVYTVFYRYDGTTYVTRRHDWGNPGYKLVDLGGDGVPEFLTRDDRFNYAFSCYACSGTPVRVFRVVRQRLADVTRSFPSLVRRDAASLWRSYRSARRERADPAGLLPAYVADEYLVGRGGPAWARLRRAVAVREWPKLVQDPRWRSRRRYEAAVRSFLRRTGYLR